MTVTHNDIVRLLAMAAAIDDQPVDEAKISAWKAMAEYGEWPSFEAARKALIVYRSEHPDFPLRPGHITQVLERVKTAAMATFDPTALPMPDDAANDQLAYKRWIAELAAAHHAKALRTFVAGRPALRAIGPAS